jgi:sporulation protein YlmC with PRC-barrel domain
MEIPLNAHVECTDGVYGRSIYVLINPVTDKVTHLVVKGDFPPNTEYTVPVDFVIETKSDTIRLRCSKAELEKMEGFISTTYIQERVPDNRAFGYSGGMYASGSYYYLPYVTTTRTVYEAVENQQIPEGELALHRGTRVEATDGFVGKVDEFVVDAENSRVTDLVMREGHLWGKKDVIIPLSAVKETKNDTVFLKLDKQAIDSLPIFPLHRRWSS